MGFKNDDRCLDNVAEDEPIFVLRANDELAVEVVQYWILLSTEQGLHESKLDEAREWVNVMREWKEAHP